MSFLDSHPHLLKEWGHRNEEDPKNLTRGSHRKVLWVCDKGHEWRASVKNRVKGSKCPYCSNRKVLKGYNDLETTHPHLAREWSPLNESTASEVVAGSNRKVQWEGACGHTWTQSISKRVARLSGCSYCAVAGTKILPGFNDLETKYPKVANQWSPRNELKPSQVFPKSTKKYWWVGECGHEWESAVANRTVNASGCPYCATNPKVLPEFNDLATTNPEIAEEWDYEKNEDTPQEVTSGSGRVRWWKCQKQHSWKAGVGTRARRQAGCPYCTGKRPIEGETDLATLRPDVVKEWDTGRNEKPASEYTENSRYKAGWICDRGHRWRASIQDRTRIDGRHTGCPTCSATSFSSRGEKEVAEFVKSLGFQVETTYRGLPGVSEVDILIEGVKVAIEYNGLYWHSERHHTKKYHKDKLESVKRAGYQLIYVWEDDWQYQRPIVEKMLARKLGVSQEPKLDARKLSFGEVTSSQASEFLNEHHIQGASGGFWRGGLFLEGELVALMVLKKRSEGDVEIVRYATSAIVRGGHSRLLKNAIGELNPRKVVTFSDNGVSEGRLYENSNFRKEEDISPDYKYRVGSRLEHKFNYRKARFKTDATLKYQEGLTERELATLNNLDRVYDAGKIKWVLELW